MLIRFASLLLLATLAGCATKAPIAVVEDLSPTAQPLAEGLKATYQNGLVLLQDGNYEDAVVFWKELAEAHPDLPGVWTNLGLALYRTGEYQASLDALAHVDEINAALEVQLAAAKQQEALSLNADGSNDIAGQAVDAGNTVTDLEPSTNDSLTMAVEASGEQAAVESESGLTEEELNAEPPTDEGSEVVITTGTDITEPAEEKLVAPTDTSSAEKTETDAPAIVQPVMLKPYCPVHRVRALPQRELGLFAEAEQSYKAAIACNPTDAEAHYNLGILYDLYRNDLVSALAEYKQAKALLGDDKNLDIWITDLERRSGTEAVKE
ncbi:tetratricopeptide repeat protein [Thalassolituus sp.]|jgi:tetratricopeptide (TPR) repeat protein|uniref:tetratricopeptide repeat protein n=1 Tax=Thalassolituus sp. TaxID=2030822 RepID=UPI0032D9A15E